MVIATDSSGHRAWIVWHIVERHRDRALGERGRDALGDVETGYAVGIVPTRAVGKGQGDHDQLLLLTRCLRTQVSVAVNYPLPD
jgi:hypothetical protein